jgi:hypothetical protein
MKFAELAWAAGDEPNMRFTSYDGKFWLAAGRKPAALWGLDSPARRHVYPAHEFYDLRPITAYDIDMETLKDPRVSLEDLKKREVVPAEVEVYETPALAQEAGRWVNDARLKEIVPRFLEHHGEGWLYVFLRQDPKEKLAYRLTSRHTNRHRTDEKEDAEIAWLKSYLEAQKIPFEIENQFNDSYPHLDRVKVT